MKLVTMLEHTKIKHLNPKPSGGDASLQDSGFRVQG